MHNNEASDGSTNWRKPWPQGIDNADGDAEVIDMFNHSDRRTARDEPKRETYPW